MRMSLREDPKKLDYPIVTKPDRYEDGSECIVAEHPDLPGCFAHGKDATEAKALLAEAKDAYLDYLLTRGFAIPDPSDLRPLEWQVGRMRVASTTVYTGTTVHWMAPALIVQWSKSDSLIPA